ncbi:hypothetical protein [Luteimonas sp. R10]|uniref:hypothetical protein n=1 Tax=Luteimonas sp. R10 TaxID=3108176 RepID=UPI003087946F|nr:hypothetical protein U3649_01950 [Luteimonas sp. R10]
MANGGPGVMGQPAEVDGTGQSGDAVDLQAGMEQLLQDFEAALREEHALGQGERDDLLARFGEALNDAAQKPATSDGSLDRSVWLEAVEALQSSGAMADGDANDLIRQIDRAMEPLERRESQIAIEFSRRMQADGQEKALAWFREQQAKRAEDESSSSPQYPTADAAAAPLRSEVVNSRSRRLRGPPSRR